MTIPDTVSISQTIPFEAVCAVEDPCWRFNDLNLQANGLDVFVAVRAKRDLRESYIQVLSTIKASGNYKPASVGKYTFHFWQSFVQTLDTTVVVR